MSGFPFKVKATYEYKSGHDDDLSFPNGQIITVTEEEENDWYIGEYVDSSGTKHEGLFPRNFVKRYEPEAPPRPTRSRTKKETALATEGDAESTTPLRTIDEPLPASQPVSVQPLPRSEEVSAVDASHLTSESKTAPPQKATSTGKNQAPPVAEKPSSFRDRIAAFNKTSSSPVVPVKPGAPPGGGFVKKPFVPPPPARDAFVPPPREMAAAKVYRREEDPEILERQAQNLEDAERAGLVPAGGEESGEETPRATTLKERIALLQKQQQEQALRRSEMALKEANRPPMKKRTDSNDNMAETTELEPGQLSRVNTAGSGHRMSMEGSRENARAPLGRRQSREYRSSDPRSVQGLGEGTDADQLRAGETAEEMEDISTEVDDAGHKTRVLAGMSSPGRNNRHEAGEADIEEGDEDDDEEQQQDEMDPETRRKMELRERMARMSGGMGMAGMFGPPIGMSGHSNTARTKRASGANEQRPILEDGRTNPMPRTPTIPLPGIDRHESPEQFENEPAVEKEPESAYITAATRPEYVADVEDIEPVLAPSSATRAMASPSTPLARQRSMPSTPNVSGRPVPQPSFHQMSTPPVPVQTQQASVPSEIRGAPLPPPHGIRSTSPESGSDEDRSMRQSALPVRSPPPPQREPSMRGPPPPIPSGGPARPEGPRSPPPSSAGRTSFMHEAAIPTSPTQVLAEKRTSRPPPIPTSIPSAAPIGEIRAPPPPPPTAIPPGRQSSMIEHSRSPVEEASNDEESDYEGDYDTDIASGASYRDTSKGLTRERTSDDRDVSEDIPATRVPSLPSSAAPPIPSSAPRAVPPLPPPGQRAAPPAPPHQQLTRPSMDAPRTMPPVPPSRDDLPSSQEEEVYDPYNYTTPSPTHGLMQSTMAWMPDKPVQESDPSFYGTSSQRTAERAPPLPPQGPNQDRVVHSSAPVYQQPSVPQSSAIRQSREVSRQSSDFQSTTMPSSSIRRSADQSRPSGDQTYIAQDVDLSEPTLWWTQPNLPPPVFQKRTDVRCEFEESTTSKRGGRTTVAKDIYILFPDYSQTVISARFDPKEPTDITFEQRHEAPPPMPRKDALEAAHQQFGNGIATAAGKRLGQHVLDGSPHALVYDCIRQQANALLPIGPRAFGVCVYANLANATVQQFDEIRPGDIITFRNAKFSGKHGAMHAKYSEDVGKPDHVGIVAEWDGSKRKIKVLEQGREARKGVRAEGFRIGDLKSGEVKVWRVMNRKWVGWETQS